MSGSRCKRERKRLRGDANTIANAATPQERARVKLLRDGQLTRRDFGAMSARERRQARKTLGRIAAGVGLSCDWRSAGAQRLGHERPSSVRRPYEDRQMRRARAKAERARLSIQELIGRGLGPQRKGT